MTLQEELRALEKGLSAKRASHQEHAKGNRYVSRPQKVAEPLTPLERRVWAVLGASPMRDTDILERLYTGPERPTRKLVHVVIFNLRRKGVEIETTREGYRLCPASTGSVRSPNEWSRH